jgi:hypothetical protein
MDEVISLNALNGPPNGEYKAQDINGGKQLIAKYPNGYGASIVQHHFSYGGKEGLFELAVFHPNRLCYATPITSDVIGWLTAEDVVKILHDINNLPPNDNCDHSQPYIDNDPRKDEKLSSVLSFDWMK